MRLIICLTLSFIFVFLIPEHGLAHVHTSANNAVLIEQSTGRVLYEKNAHEIESIASITKIMTAILAIESGEMASVTKTSKQAIHTEGSSIYLEQGEKMSIEDLVYGLMLRSGNDAAVAISEHVGGSEEGFVHLMNEKASWLGMTNTHFDNPHGLDSEEHYSTAYDMALLMQYAMKNKVFRKISGTTTHQAEHRSYAWQNKNKLLTSIYDKCIAGKTGFTKQSGRTLITSAQQDNLDLIAVTLNAPDDWRDHIQMYEWGFDNYQLETIAEKGQSIFKQHDSERTIVGVNPVDLTYPLTKLESSMLDRRTLLVREESNSRKDRIGQTEFYLQGSKIAELPIYRDEQSGFLMEVKQSFKRIVGLK